MWLEGSISRKWAFPLLGYLSWLTSENSLHKVYQSYRYRQSKHHSCLLFILCSYDNRLENLQNEEKQLQKCTRATDAPTDKVNTTVVSCSYYVVMIIHRLENLQKEEKQL